VAVGEGEAGEGGAVAAKEGEPAADEEGGVGGEGAAYPGEHGPEVGGGYVDRVCPFAAVEATGKAVSVVGLNAYAPLSR